MVKTIFSDFLHSDFLLWSLFLALWVYVPYLETGGTLWLLWEIVGAWSNTMWLLRLDRENASLLFYNGYPRNLPILLWGNLSRSPSRPHDEGLKSLIHSLGWYFICIQNQLAGFANEATQSGFSSCQLMKLQRAKMSHPHGVLPKVQIHEKNKRWLLF